MSIVNERLQTPLYSTWFCGILVGMIAATFELKSLVDMMSIGTLMAYTGKIGHILLPSQEMSKRFAPDLVKLPKNLTFNHLLFHSGVRVCNGTKVSRYGTRPWRLHDYV